MFTEIYVKHAEEKLIQIAPRSNTKLLILIVKTFRITASNLLWTVKNKAEIFSIQEE